MYIIRFADGKVTNTASEDDTRRLATDEMNETYIELSKLQKKKHRQKTNELVRVRRPKNIIAEDLYLGDR